jgi:DNA-binding MarR family transcriptional regulator
MMTKIENKFGVDAHKLHLLGIADEYWARGSAVRVTELIDKYEGASRATTHKAIKELVSADFLRMVGDDNDRRVRYLHPGKKLATLEKLL